MADDQLTIVRADGTTETLRSTDVGSGVQAQVVLAGEHVRTFDGVQSLDLTGSSQALTVPSGATHAAIYCEGSSTTDYARYWEDGTAPTSSVGKKLKDHEEIENASPATFHAIVGSGTLTLRISYYHYA